MRMLCISTLSMMLLTTPTVSGSNQVAAHYVDFGDQGTSQLLAADAAGNVFVVGTVVEPWGSPQIRVVKTDPQGKTLATLDFGGSFADAPTGAAVDPLGNLVIVGSTESSDFPLITPLISQTYPRAAFILKIDSRLDRILFSTRLGGSYPGTFGGAVAIDHAGNIFVSGSTGSRDFPVTPRAFQSQPPNASSMFASYYAFVTEISSNGDRIVFSTYFGADQTVCPNPRSCSNQQGKTGATTLSLDPTGAVVIAGNTNSIALPVTSGAYAQQCGVCQVGSSVGFIAKLGSDGSALLWATYFPSSVRTAALTSDGGVVLGGSAPTGFPTTLGSLQISYPTPPATQGIAYEAGYVAKLDPTGSRLLFSTYLGGNVTHSSGAVADVPVNGVNSIALDTQGNICATGGSIPASMPLAGGTPILGDTYSIALSPDGTRLVTQLTAPFGTAGQGVVVTAQGIVVTLGVAGSILMSGSVQGPSLVGVVNSAGFEVSGTVAPSELISLYGLGLGPTTPVEGQFVNQVLTTSLGDVQVLFDGVPAPLLYAGPNLINVIVPSAVYRRSVTVLEIITPAGTTIGTTLFVAPTQPQVFRNSTADSNLTFGAIALNLDGTLNSAQKPAPSGSIVTIWATGAPTPSAYYDGGIVTGAISGPQAPVSVLVNRSTETGFSSLDSLEVLYAGDAPKTVKGVIQIRFRLPAGHPRGPYQLQIGTALSDPFVIYQQP